ncbi:MAG: hypothetical protein KA187_00920 [Arenimonas sp.]|nr:hypothetical protein [Arenimonas sp.]MBP6625955.1 hypothetical protein [Arenimonas sp.]
MIVPVFTRCMLMAALLLSATAHAQDITSVPGEAAWTGKASAAPAWRAPAGADGPASRIVFRELPVARIVELEDHNAQGALKPTQVGVARLASDDALVELPPLRWSSVPGGAVARIEAHSPDALALRVGLRVSGLDPRVELRFAGSDNLAKVVARVDGEEATRLAGDRRVYWTPVTDGERQVIELFAPAGVDTGAIQVAVPEVSHLVTNSQRGFSLAKIGESESCNVDTACRVAALGANFVNAKNAVARMIFTDGGTFTCTGTLLNDTVPATQLAYFYTANHCISTQAVASTLLTFWGYEATSCGSGVQAANIQLTGGAQYLYSSDAGNNPNAPAGTDAALLRLNGTPPNGAFFAGWDAAPLAASSSVLAIHHPSGDVKKSSLGQQMSSNAQVNFVAWTSGTTEGGSSGSGLFTSSGSGYALRGGLWGGSASCANSGSVNTAANRDWYSRLDVAYPSIQQYLAPGAAGAGPTRNNGGLWYVPSESGWGLTAFQFAAPGNVLFVTWYAYGANGQPMWYQIDGSWTGTDVNSGPVRRYAGPTWGTSFNPAQVSYANVGTATLTFTSATSATLEYTVDGVSRTVTLSKIGG